MSLNVALVHAYAWPEVRRGGERLVDDLTAYLRRAGHRVDVYSGTKGESRFHPGTQGRDYRFHVPSFRPLERAGVGRIETFGVRALAPLLLHRYDVVHAFTPTAALASIAAGQPTIYTVIGHPTAATLPRHRLQRSALARAVGLSTEVAVLSRSAARALEEALGRRAIILPPGVPASRFEPRLEPRTEPPKILFSGDLGNPDKGLAVLVAAFERVLHKHPDARLLLSGPGTTNRVEQDAAASWERIRPAVDVLGTGAVEDVPERYRSAHVTVLPSRDEAFGIVLVESLASGTPVVGGEPGGAEDIIEPDVGRLVRHGDADGLAVAIDECIRLAGESGTAERCRESAEAWDWANVGPRYEAAYLSIAGRRRLPGLALLRPAGPAEPSAARPNPSSRSD
jgi:phosphatidylinositol alpha-mannosyltransferase